MARAINKLTARQIHSLTDSGRYSDGGNLYLSVSPNGGRRWVFLYRHGGRQREMGLGSATKAGVSLVRARELAAEARAHLGSGIDPLEARRADKAANQTIPSFGDWADAYVETHRKGWRNKKHADQWSMTLTRYCASIRSMPVDTIDTEAVLHVLHPIWERLPETAQRLRGRIENVLDAAKARGLRSGENPARWRGHLQNLLSKPKKLSRGHHAAMPYAQVPAFMVELQQRRSTASCALEFAILTAARTSEALNASWDEIDLERALWNVPGSRMKSGREHRVPLSSRVIELLTNLDNPDNARFLFPGARWTKPLSSMAMTMQLRRMKKDDVTVHGFRSSFRDWASETTMFTHEVCEQALAHTISSKTEAAYRRGDLLEKRRELMEAWAVYCGGTG